MDDNNVLVMRNDDNDNGEQQQASAVGTRNTPAGTIIVDKKHQRKTSSN